MSKFFSHSYTRLKVRGATLIEIIVATLIVLISIACFMEAFPRIVQKNSFTYWGEPMVCLDYQVKKAILNRDYTSQTTDYSWGKMEQKVEISKDSNVGVITITAYIYDGRVISRKRLFYNRQTYLQ